MKTHSDHNDDRQGSLWEYVPLAEFCVPQAEIALKIRGGFAGFWQRLRPAGKQPDNPLKSEEELQALPQTLQDSVVPALDWREPADVLGSSLATWIDASPNDRPFVLVVGAPNSGNPSILKLLATQHGWELIAPPPAEQILSRDNGWLHREGNADTLWVMPNLEKCFLRHSNGLAPIRQLIMKLNAGLGGRGIVGCDSWAWAYLNTVIPGVMPAPLVAQAFDHDRLSSWLLTLAAGGTQQNVPFCQTNTGAYVLPPQAQPAEDGAAPVETTAFVRHLAAHCRGIPGVAWSIWRDSLRDAPDEALSETPRSDIDLDRQTTIWVLPWDDLKQPSLPAETTYEHILVLHGLLLHCGVSAEVLTEILPLSHAAIMGAIGGLKDSGVIEQIGEIWQVTVKGYPVVRQFLNDAGYFVDNL